MKRHRPDSNGRWLLVGLLSLLSLTLVVMFAARRASPPIERQSPEAGKTGEAPELPSYAPPRPATPDDEAEDVDAQETEIALPGPAASNPGVFDESDPVDGEPLGTVLYGLVIYEGATPRPGREAHLLVVDEAGTRTNHKVGADGRYSIAGLTEGRWWIQAGCLGFESERQAVTFDEEDRVLRQDFTLRSSIRIRIKLEGPNGQSLREMFDDPANADLGGLYRNLVPVATLEPPGARFTEVIGSHNNPFGVGQFWESGFVFDNLGPGYMGIVLLDEPPPVYMSLVNYHNVLETKPVGPGTEEVVFRITPDLLRGSSGGVTFRVLDARTSEPIEGASPMLSNSRSARPLRAGTDAEGRITIEGRPPGDYDLLIRQQGYASFRERVRVEAGEILDLGDFRLEEERTVSGVALDPSGAPVSVKVSLDRLHDSGKVERFASRNSGRDGSFQMSGLSPARYRMQVADGENVSHAQIVDLTNGSIEGLTVEVTPSERLVFEPGELPFRALEYSIVNSLGIPVAGRRFYADTPIPVMLPAGRYVARVRDRSTKDVLLEQEFELGNGETIVIRRP